MHIHIHKVELDASLVFLEAAISVSPMGAGEDFESTARTMEVENLSLDPPTMSIDLLQRFMGNAREHEVARGEDEGIELNLGLSLGGRFCVEKSSNQLVRSSSIASCLPVAKVAKDDGDVSVPASAPAAHTELVRTSSLPVETEEEWRKRKELQTLRRMEAKRRRSEKQRSLRIDREGSGIGGGGGGSLSLEERKEIEVGLRERLEGEKSVPVVKRSSSSVVSQLRLFEWASAAASEAILGSGIDAALAKGKGRIGQPGSQGSMESKGGSSSGGSDLESKALQGSSGELSPASIQSLQEASSQDVGSSATKARGHMRQMARSDMESPSKKVDSSRTRGREIRSNSMEDMPCVFTKGDGPNGRRVDGILYKYGKGEEVRIMCVCHGSFHSPAEFVEHAGGTDVDHPLKHIVVNPNSSSLL